MYNGANIEYIYEYMNILYPYIHVKGEQKCYVCGTLFSAWRKIIIILTLSHVNMQVILIDSYITRMCVEEHAGKW